jgi:hypothetical protein
VQVDNNVNITSYLKIEDNNGLHTEDDGEV